MSWQVVEAREHYVSSDMAVALRVTYDCSRAGQDYEAAHDAVAKQAQAARQGGAGPPGGPPPYGARPPMGFPPHGPPPGYQVRVGR